MKRFSVVIAAVVFCAMCPMGQGFCGQEQAAKIIKISPADQRAVIQVPGKPLKLVKPGDSLSGFGKIIEIARDRVVCEKFEKNGPETLIIRLDGETQTVQRFSRMPDKSPPLYSPVGANTETKQTGVSLDAQ